MGLEISIELRREGRDPIQIGYVCGRDEATLYVANLCDNEVKEGDEEAIPTILLPIVHPHAETEANARKTAHEILDELSGYAAADELEVQKAELELKSLLETRKNCVTFEAYHGFADAIDGTRDWLRNNKYSRAASLRDDLARAIAKADSIAMAESTLREAGWGSLQEPIDLAIIASY